MKSFYLSKEDLIDSQKIASYYEKINEFNKQLVDIHCTLTKKEIDLCELYLVQEGIDELTEKFYVFNFGFETKFSNSIAKNKRFGMFLKLCIPLSLFNVVIPEIGIMLTLFLEMYNYLNIRANNEALFELEKSYANLMRKCNIIKDNIAVKYKLLNERIKECSNKVKTESFKYENEEELNYYYALQIIGNYLNDFNISLEGIEDNTLYAMRDILQAYLNSDNNDLDVLLSQVKGKTFKLVRKTHN